MIDKVIPNKLQADLDERLLNPESGQMVDALNVTRALSGNPSTSTSGTISNTYGTEVVTPLLVQGMIQDDGANGYTIIGKVEDDVRGLVYWFVSDDNNGNDDAIYRQDPSANTYTTVLKGDLNFNSNSFVKADVVTAQFQQNGVTQSVLYFTDNVNPPRKINADRAIVGAYQGGTDAQVRDFIQAIRGAETRYPEFSFVSDTTVKTNGFLDSVFQFATQYVYIDGEESAISPYSALAAGRGMSLSNIEHDTSSAPTLSSLTDNVCEVSLNIDPNQHDIEEVRLLARKGNSGAFYVVDQFNPNVNFVRSVYGNTNTVYSATTGVYKFYNDRMGPTIPTTTTNKLYDNIPLLARGQSISGKRLVYSNYSEGRANKEITSGDITLSVNYSSENTAENSLIPSGAVNSVIKQGGQGTQEVKIDLIGGDAFGGSATSATTVAGGTKVNLSFTIQPTAGQVAKSGSGGALVSFGINQVDTTINPSVTHTGTATLSTLDLSSNKVDANTNGSNPPILVNISYTTPFDTTVEGVRDALKNIIEQLPEAPVRYDMADNTPLTLSAATGSTLISTVTTASEFEVFYKLDDITALSGGTASDQEKAQLVIKTRISKVSFEEVTFGAAGRTTTGSDLGDVLVNEMDEASDFSITTGASGVANQSATAITMESVSGFKSGSTHNFGIVYYDQFNRSGFVNKIGSIYVPTPAERITPPKGAASIRVTFSDNYSSPVWATRYQIVYPGRGSVGDFTQYTVGGAFGARKRNDTTDGNFDTTLDTNSKRLYVSLKTLDIYNKEKSSSRSYSFTKGDKLRVISHRAAADNSTTYPLSEADGGGGDGNPIEFDVVGVEVLGSNAQTNPIVGGAVDDSVPVEKTGTFLVLEAPEIAAGVGKYIGFDWFSVTDTVRTSTTVSGTSNKWPQQTVVEIFSPKTLDENTVYYEIGHGAQAGIRKDGSNSHGTSIDLYNGDIFNKPISCKSPVYDTIATTWNPASSEDWEYKTVAIETSNPSEKRVFTDWNKGRAHAVFENAATVRRENGITYSDAYEEDVANLSLSSFNPSLANFLSLDRQYGGVNYIGNRGRSMIALQENKVATVAIDERIITQSDGGQLAALATSPFTLTGYYSGDFGCGSDPSAVLFRDGYVFFFDRSRRKILKLTSEGISSVSDIGVQSIVLTNSSSLANTPNAMVSGYDPRTNEYYFTFRPTTSPSYAGLTISYSPSIDGWQSRHSFFPDMYACMNDEMYSAFYVAGTGALNDQTIFHKHTDATNRATFYGTSNASSVKVVFNNNPSLVKTFNAVSYEGTPNSFNAASLESSDGDSGDTLGFVQIEGSEYSSITRARSANTYSNVIGLGTLDSDVAATATTLTFANRINRIPIPVNSVLMMVSGGNLVNIGVNSAAVLFNSVASAFVINADGANINTSLSGIADGVIVAVPPASHDGNTIRGHWCSANFAANPGTAAYELYALNAHTTQSKNNHALGQQ